MNPSQVKQLLPYLIAFADGKEVQFRMDGGNWYPCTYSTDLELGDVDAAVEYRIKPEPVVVRSRRWLLNTHYPHVGIANNIADAIAARAHPGFIRWLDNDWQEVEV